MIIHVIGKRVKGETLLREQKPKLARKTEYEEIRCVFLFHVHTEVWVTAL